MSSSAGMYIQMTSALWKIVVKLKWSVVLTDHKQVLKGLQGIISVYSGLILSINALQIAQIRNNDVILDTHTACTRHCPNILPY